LVESLLGLLGIWLIASRLPDFLSSAFVSVTGQEHISGILLATYGVHLAGYCITGLALLLLRARIARWLVNEDRPLALHPENFVGSGVAIFAVFFVVSGLVSIGESLVFLSKRSMENPYLFWRGITSCTLGIVLFLVSPRIGQVFSVIQDRRNTDRGDSVTD